MREYFVNSIAIGAWDMIFAHTLHQVICGEKRQTRRVIKNDEAFDSDNLAIVKSNSRVMYKVGKSYSVQPNRGKKAVARILITDIRKEQVGSISDADAVDEGFQSRDEFLNTWHSIHGQNADLEHEVWVIEFELHSIVPEELKVAFDEILQKDQSTDHSKDLSGTVAEVSGSRVYSWYNGGWRMGSPVSDRLSVFTP